ncbi:unnamed protein product [Prorocentrum cordatum]|uniref:Peptidase M3A/M3B catalytic domain-containing protein n=1 Tax=Prorocentrum cordatum TaxID=2364126 RepID=A0ABN9WU33_9DINO|nr:unnamed protein product [Polarella glacialis]
MAAGSEPGAPPARACSVKAPVLVPITRRAVCPEARRKMMEASQRRCIMGKNGPLLLELLGKRHAAARALGFASHAERMLSTKMAETPQRARHFCEDMLARLAPQRDAELRRLGARKACDGAGRQRGQKRGADGSVVPEEDGCPVEPWDVPFYMVSSSAGDLLKREELCFDDEKTKEFFPLVATIDKLLAVYSEMLGFTFSRSATLPTWHEEVAAFEVRRREGGELVGHIGGRMLDQHPRVRDNLVDDDRLVRDGLPLAPSFVIPPRGGAAFPRAPTSQTFLGPRGTGQRCCAGTR